MRGDIILRLERIENILESAGLMGVGGGGLLWLAVEWKRVSGISALSRTEPEYRRGFIHVAVKRAGYSRQAVAGFIKVSERTVKRDLAMELTEYVLDCARECQLAPPKPLT